MKRRSSVIPYGWRLSDAAPRFLEPVEDEQEALAEALDYVQVRNLGLSLTATRDCFSRPSQTGRRLEPCIVRGILTPARLRSVGATSILRTA